MENKPINIQVVSKVARALGTLNEKVVFVGGAVVSVYADDAAAEEVRPTDDIDFTVELTGYGSWVSLNEELQQLGFTPDAERSAICSFLFQGIKIDVMPAENSPIGETNSWYKPGFECVKKVVVHNQEIRVLSLPYYLATKLEAFLNRGGDYRVSHDFEDVIYVIDNSTSVVAEIQEADEPVKIFIQTELEKVIKHSYVEEIIQSQLHPANAAGRYPIIIEKIKQIVHK